MTIWSKSSLTSLTSDCRRWNIAKVTVNGVARYELWSRIPTRFVAAFTTAEAAKTYHASQHEATP